MAHTEKDLLQAVDAAVRELNSTQNCDRLLHNMIQHLVKALAVKTCAVVELNAETEFLEIRKSHNLSYRFCKNYRQAIDTPLLRALLWQGEAISIPDRNYALRVVEHLHMEHDFVSAYVTPLISQQQPLGFLYVDADQLNYFDEERKQIIDIFAGVIAACLFWDRLAKKLGKLRMEDEESGTMRFEYCLPILKDHFHRSMRMNEPYSLLLVDVEKYGALITTYGLQTAQAVLREIVDTIKTQLRKYDTVCRFGGDEFLISLPAVQREDALKVAGKIEQALKGKRFSPQQLAVGIFVGVASFPQNAKSFDGLLLAVKNALQEAKRKDQAPKIAVVETVYE